MDQKLIADFTQAGCKNPKDRIVAAQIYLELCQIKKYWDLEHGYDENLETLYITGKKNKNADLSLFIPADSTTSLSFEKLQSYFAVCEKLRLKSYFLALVTTDSTCVYYEMTTGLCEPTDIKVKHLQENMMEKLDSDLIKHRKIIEESALCGIPITIRTELESEKK